MNLENSANFRMILLIPLSLSIPFYIAFALKGKQWELLIPAWMLTILPIITPFSDLINPDLLASLYILAISLPFQVVFLVNRQFKWAIIVAEVLGGVALVPLGTLFIYKSFLAVLVVLTVGLPFLLILFVKNDLWPFIISGSSINIGILTLSDILILPLGVQHQVLVISFLTIGAILLAAKLLIKKDSHQSIREMLDPLLNSFSGLMSLASIHLGKLKNTNPG